LEGAREKLLLEERLAAVGRLSSAIAHEIRNPVAMISSSLATAKGLSGKEREEMFAIASEEAERLVTLTTDFLAYARPRAPKLTLSSVSDTVAYVADACRALASQKGVELEVDASGSLLTENDSGQLQQALINLVMNAVQASAPGGRVWLRARDGNRRVTIDVENCGSPIPEPELSRIFEPFFTTRPQGSGLGLAIARNIALAHHGDLRLAVNGPERVCFSLTLPMRNGSDSKKTG
jgi:two-component system, NtrC family, sensor histidine kinase HydH